jgi:hypothetical protein
MWVFLKLYTTRMKVIETVVSNCSDVLKTKRNYHAKGIFN